MDASGSQKGEMKLMEVIMRCAIGYEVQARMQHTELSMNVNDKCAQIATISRLQDSPRDTELYLINSSACHNLPFFTPPMYHS